MSRRTTIVLAAGGTGGHVFPANAAAAALARRGHRVVLASDGRGQRFEGDVEIARIAAASLGGGLLAKLGGACKIGVGVLQAMKLLISTRADVVVGFGGYPSLPTVLAALLLRRPVALHDQNAVLGRVNRLFAGRAKRIATAFPAVAGAPAERSTLVGNPVRAEILAIGGTPYRPTADRLDLLVFGGSQGARILSDLLPAAVARLPEPMRARLNVVQQCRPEDIDRVGAAYDEIGQDAELKSFFDDMPARLTRARLVVARAGASTVAELAAAGRPAILIPFAAAMDDHQTANAEALVAAGAAWRLDEAEATPERLAALLADILADDERLTAAAEAARGVARPDAADALADLIEDIAAREGRTSTARLAGGMAA